MFARAPRTPPQPDLIEHVWSIQVPVWSKKKVKSKSYMLMELTSGRDEYITERFSKSSTASRTSFSIIMFVPRTFKELIGPAQGVE